MMFSSNSWRPLTLRGHFALLEHVGFEFGEADLARFDFRADALVPGGVSLAHEFG